MKNIYQLVFCVMVLSNLSFAGASDVKMMTCYFDRDQNPGGGRANIFTSSEGWVSLSAESLDDPYLNLAFTRTFSELGVIGLTEHVVAVSYSDFKGSHCEKGIDARDVTCKEKLGQIAIVTHRRDKSNVIHEKKFTALFDSVEIISQRTDEGAAQMWEFVKDGKFAYTRSLSLSRCEYGVQHWDN